MKAAFFWVAAFGALHFSSPLRAQSQVYDQARLIELARSGVRAGVRGEAAPKFESKSVAQPVFVTIERFGKVLGCRGSLRARTHSLEAEIAVAARSVAATDPRYPPLTPAQLQQFRVTITVVERQIPLDVSAISSLQCEEGLVLQVGNRTGIVLPWEGSDPLIRLGWAYKKAGVTPGAKCRLFRLKAERFAG